MDPKAAALFLLCSLILLPSSAKASTTADSAAVAPHLEVLAVLEDRLDLSPEQATAVEPVLAQHHVEQQAVFEQLRINPNASRSAPRPSRGELFKLANALFPVWNQTNIAMADILTEAQMDEWMRYQNERRNHLRRRLQGRR